MLRAAHHLLLTAVLALYFNIFLLSFVCVYGGKGGLRWSREGPKHVGRCVRVRQKNTQIDLWRGIMEGLKCLCSLSQPNLLDKWNLDI